MVVKEVVVVVVPVVLVVLVVVVIVMTCLVVSVEETMPRLLPLLLPLVVELVQLLRLRMMMIIIRNDLGPLLQLQLVCGVMVINVGTMMSWWSAVE
jgi:hypothetical protein